MGRVRRLLLLLPAWWFALFWIWLLFVGEWNALEWMAAAAAGLVAAVAAVVVHELGVLGFRLRPRLFAPVPSVLWAVVVDFGLLVRVLARALLRRQVPRGVFRARPFDAGPVDGPLAAGRRGVLGALATYSPNAYLIDIDPERGEALVHDLVPRRSSEKPL